MATTEDESAVDLLLSVEYSRRLLLMRAILDAADDLPEAAAAGVREAWQLLESAEKRAPEALRAALLDPQVGLWAATLFRRLSRTDGAVAGQEVPLWVEFGFLGQFAAAVAILAGAPFLMRVPVREGSVFLPGLGRAHLDTAEPWGTAEVRARDGVVRVAVPGEAVTLPEDPEHDAPGWEGLRRLRAAHAGLSLTLTLDDLGPYQAVTGLAASGRLAPDEFDHWQRRISAMWSLLVTDHRADAVALSAGLSSLVPLPHRERLRSRTASSSDAFGCVLLSEPDEDTEVLPAELGVTLVHEFRHTLLNGLIFLVPLFEECGDLFYAPWRDDPRPLGGLVHGAYAFSGVARYWRARGTDGLAGYEFALWRDAVQHALTTLRSHPLLTPLGRQLVEALTEQSAPWRDEPVGEREQALARLASAHHQAAWRAHHLRPPTAYAEELARGWEHGRPPADRAPEPELHPDPDACRLDTLALLARLSIVDPAEFARLLADDAPESEVRGCGPADLALVAGEAETAVKLYAEELAVPDARPAAWAGLGLALTECGERDAGAVLTDSPELVVAVSRLLPGRPDPVALARWLARRPGCGCA
ncbi:HEXXH motif domain-containing protein [Streptomyces guryensis]|uniref:HEXXH motif-containing putative peptide modification protein n=1 Tax=Streptomyces guryensis TaxID=2886947 RepID=A0A9Q3VR45_9ACTN|nr:HEXXH motif domain-containing protein [Streptomyces guryensis]MCD9875645.1 HEXXH motif-containing putative peptide modification protein [Streptomyces guryensis]